MNYKLKIQSDVHGGTDMLVTFGKGDFYRALGHLPEGIALPNLLEYFDKHLPELDARRAYGECMAALERFRRTQQIVERG